MMEFGGIEWQGFCCKKPISADAFNKPIDTHETFENCVIAWSDVEPDEIQDRTPATARSSRAPPEPGRTFRCGLLARCAGVHVDFHAHRHFDDFWSLPSHSGSSQLIWREVHTGAEPRAASDAAQVSNGGGNARRCRNCASKFLSRTKPFLS